MADIKVLHVVGGSQFGGIAPYIVSLARMVREHGGDAKVLVTAPRVVNYFRERGIEVVPIKGIERSINPLVDMAGLVRLFTYLQNSDYQIVHTHTSKGGIIGRLAARLARIPIIIHTTQGYAFSDYARNGIERWLFMQIEKRATGWCDFIIAANQVDREKAIEVGIATESKIVTIPNGIDIASIDAVPPSPDLRDKLELDANKRIVGVIARLSPQKGIEYFLDAIPGVMRMCPATQFIVVGDGPLMSELQARAQRLGIEQAVKFVGFRQDWVEILRLMDVFVMPSLWEGLPMTLLGAMAAGRSIVATRIKGIVDVCGNSDAALLVEPHDRQALAQAIIALLADDTRAREYGQAARRLVEEKYSDRVMSERIWQIYDCLLAKKLPLLTGG